MLPGRLFGIPPTNEGLPTTDDVSRKPKPHREASSLPQIHNDNLRRMQLCSGVYATRGPRRADRGLVPRPAYPGGLARREPLLGAISIERLFVCGDLYCRVGYLEVQKVAHLAARKDLHQHNQHSQPSLTTTSSTSPTPFNLQLSSILQDAFQVHHQRYSGHARSCGRRPSQRRGARYS